MPLELLLLATDICTKSFVVWGLCPRPLWGSLHRSLDRIAGLGVGPTGNGKEGGEGRDGKGREGGGRPGMPKSRVGKPIPGIAPWNESSRELSFQGAKVPTGNFRRGAKILGSEKSPNRVRHRVRIRVPFRPITVRSAIPFRKLSYSCEIRNETQSFRSALPFPEIIPTRIHSLVRRPCCAPALTSP